MSKDTYLSTTESPLKDQDFLNIKFLKELESLTWSRIFNVLENKDWISFEVYFINEFLTKCNNKKICELLKTNHAFVKTRDVEENWIKEEPKSVDLDDMEIGLRYTENNDTSDKGPSPFALDRYLAR